MSEKEIFSLWQHSCYARVNSRRSRKAAVTHGCIIAVCAKNHNKLFMQMTELAGSRTIKGKDHYKYGSNSKGSISFLRNFLQETSLPATVLFSQTLQSSSKIKNLPRSEISALCNENLFLCLETWPQWSILIVQKYCCHQITIIPVWRKPYNFRLTN